MKSVAPLMQTAAFSVAGADFDFIEEGLKLGALYWVDWIDWHPYRDDREPETVIPEQLALQAMVAKYKPESRCVGFSWSEFGWPALESIGFTAPVSVWKSSPPNLLAASEDLTQRVWNRTGYSSIEKVLSPGGSQDAWRFVVKPNALVSVSYVPP